MPARLPVSGDGIISKYHQDGRERSDTHVVSLHPYPCREQGKRHRDIGHEAKGVPDPSQALDVLRARRVEEDAEPACRDCQRKKDAPEHRVLGRGREGRGRYL